jgi:hypothetical protein
MSVIILSIKDIPYSLVPNTAYHPINTDAALRRIRSDYINNVQTVFLEQPVTMDLILTTILKSHRAKSTWATVFEYRGTPFYVVRNLAHTNTTLPYRRVLVVKLDAFIIPYPMRTWDRVSSSLTHEEFYPSPSETMSQ